MHKETKGGIKKHETLRLRTDMENFPPQKGKVSHKTGYFGRKGSGHKKG